MKNSKLKNILWLSVKNIWHNKGRLMLTLSVSATSLAIIISLVSLVASFENDVKNEIAKSPLGRTIVIMPPRGQNKFNDVSYQEITSYTKKADFYLAKSIPIKAQYGNFELERIAIITQPQFLISTGIASLDFCNNNDLVLLTSLENIKLLNLNNKNLAKERVSITLFNISNNSAPKKYNARIFATNYNWTNEFYLTKCTESLTELNIATQTADRILAISQNQENKKNLRRLLELNQYPTEVLIKDTEKIDHFFSNLNKPLITLTLLVVLIISISSFNFLILDQRNHIKELVLLKALGFQDKNVFEFIFLYSFNFILLSFILSLILFKTLEIFLENFEKNRLEIIPDIDFFTLDIELLGLLLMIGIIVAVSSSYYLYQKYLKTDYFEILRSQK